MALPENVINHCKKEKNHANVYILDRGQCSVEAFADMKQNEGVKFVGRLAENRKIKQVSDQTTEEAKEKFTHGRLKEDAKVQLHRTVKTIGEQTSIGRGGISINSVSSRR